ncbi:SAM-dependent methyltransferase [Streptomyces sp. SL13]|uniref:S-adenosyl-L-methionine-dependent methyltransferase n=1 Tax=Streptantibioticus silvisoli TaxID=2705255 RepID=A0AA90H021_9ACTN|nr:SAM-dependent methyltransferase [Streptantibioticus silvisoli]MDI5961307.1 SAM-dependent methyltransferase [Streptantibioticus silvisoli]MDI5968851.1 SAM-dependent methyltransferase [Streptantibioticus silvisoli]
MTDGSGLLTGVSSTALVVGMARAAESERADRLFDDHLARRFLDAAGAGQQAVWSKGRGDGFAEAMGDYFALRTRYFDDWFARAGAAGCRQMVLLAAGLDTRAHRLDWPAGTRLFELDQPDLLAFKEHVLRDEEPRCRREVIAADLREDWTVPLAEQGFRADEPTAWLVEGVLVYLSEEDANGLLARISALSAPGSHLAVEHVTRAMVESDQAKVAAAAEPEGAVKLLSTLWKNEMTRSPGDWLGTYGWDAAEEPLTDLARRHGRAVPPAFDPASPGTGRVSLLTAVR